MPRIVILTVSYFSLVCTGVTPAADWLTHRSTYTHQPGTGQRVAQYQPIPSPTAAAQPARTSGFTHLRSTLNYGKSADNYHRVTKWGDPVQPYAAFRFPFRPYGTPYPNWGAPLIGSGTNVNIGNNAGGGGPLIDPRLAPGGFIDPVRRGGFGGGRFDGRDFGSNNFGRDGFGRDSFGPDNFRRGGFGRDGFGGGFVSPLQQPIGPLTPYPSLPLDVDRTSPIYDGYYPTYRD